MTPSADESVIDPTGLSHVRESTEHSDEGQFNDGFSFDFGGESDGLPSDWVMIFP
jgi:hypothetical protein